MSGIAIREELTDEWKKRALEKKTGKKISTSENYIDEPEIKKRLK